MSLAAEKTAAAVKSGYAAYKTLLVHVEAGVAGAQRLDAAARLAMQFEARLIGLGAETVEPMAVSDPFGGAGAPELIALMQAQVGDDLKAAEAAFKRDAAGVDAEWRSVQDFPARAVARASRAADLVIASPRSRGGSVRTADPAELVMSCGRPVLIVPATAGRLKAQTVMIAWKDTREARRAIADALPFLQRAEEVIVQAICEDDAYEACIFQTDDVAAALKRHGVVARTAVSRSAPASVPAELARLAQAAMADLVVAGAYSHSRLSEWVFGGVTDELIHRPDTYVLLSH
jgi:nucleotide-binding universal stress UspA family protein